mgnify:FL=1
MVQVITDTQEFKNSLLSDVKKELETLSEQFQPKEPTQYLTRKEVAEMLQIDLSTLHNWVKKGKLTPYGIGHRVYFKRQEIEAALKPLNQ